MVSEKGGMAYAGWSAINIPPWDITDKELGRPVHESVGGSSLVIGHGPRSWRTSWPGLAVI